MCNETARHPDARNMADQIKSSQAGAQGNEQAGRGNLFSVVNYEIHLSRHGQPDEIHGPFTADDVIAVQTKLSSMIGVSYRVVKRYGRQMF